MNDVPSTAASASPAPEEAPLSGADDSAAAKRKKKPKLKLEIAHHTPGRVRMKIPSAKGNPELLQQIGETFGVIPGVERVSVNETTGSVVLHYAREHGKGVQRHLDNRLKVRGGFRPPATEIDNLANKIQEEAEFLAQNSQSAKAIVDFFKMIDREIKVASRNTVDLKIVLAAGLIGVTVLEVGASAATPIWLTLLVFSLNHFVELQQHRLQPEPAAAPVVFKTKPA